MPPPRCLLCPSPASLRRPRTGDPLCRRCFLAAFEDETHRVIAADLTRPAHDVITPFPPSPRPGQSVAVAVSGGKDSAVLAHLLGCLERRHGYGLRASLLAVDEGIAGYREASLGAVRRGRGGLPLLLLSHRDAFGWSVDELGEGLGAASRCTYCGVLRRRALEAGARAMGVDWIATGHNADDIAETVLMNFLRGDVARLRRVASEASGTPGTPWNPPGTPRNPLETLTTSMETSRSPLETPRNPLETPKSSTETPKSSMESTQNPQETPRSSMGTPKSSMETTKNPPETPRSSTETPTTSTKPPRSPPQPPKNLSKPHPRPPKATGDPQGDPKVAPLPSIPRWKPLRHAYEKEIVLYAYYQGLDYVSTECVYAPQAYRGHARDLLKDLEATRPSTVAALGHSGRRLAVATEVATKSLGTCERCGYGASQALCKVCVLLAALEKGRPKVGLGKRSLEMAWEERGGPGGGGYGGGGHGVGGHGGDGCGDGGHGAGGHGAGGHGDGGHGDGCHGAGGHGVCRCRAGGHGDGGHGDEHHGAGSHGDGAGGHGAGGHGAGGHGVGGHGDDECGDGGPGRGAGGHGVCSCRAGGCGAGGPTGSWRRAGGTGDGEGEGVEVEVVGAGGRTVRRRFLGFGRVHGALNIWDF